MNAQRSRTSDTSPSVTSVKARPRVLHDSSRGVLASAEADGVLGYHDPEETLVIDARAGVRPAQWVEHKLCGLLKSELPVSQVRLTTPTCSREHC